MCDDRLIKYINHKRGVAHYLCHNLTSPIKLDQSKVESFGTPLIYTSTTPELVLLETLVHLNGTPLRDRPPLVRITIELPDSIE